MAFKLRSPINNKPAEFGSVPVAASSKGYAGYQSMLKDRLRSTAPKNRVGGDGGGNKSTGTFSDPQTGEKRYYDKAHQSYSSKTGLVNKSGSFKDGVYDLNKPKPKAKSVIPASQGGGSPFNYNPITGSSSNPTFIGSLVNHLSNKNNSSKGITSSSQDANDRVNKRGKYAEKASSSKGSGVIPDTNVDPNVSKRPEYITPGTGSSTVKPKDTKPTNTKPTNTSTNTTKSSSTTNTISAGSNTNKDKSGGYLKDTKNFSLGVDTKMNTSSMPKFEKTVTNARSADYDMIRAKGRGKIDRLKTRLDKREGRVANRVEASSMRIKSRQQRSGERYASKMEARTNTGTNPGKFESQKKLDAFEKAMDSPKATARTAGNVPGAGKIGDSKSMPSLITPKPNQTAAKPSMKLNTSKQTSITIDDSRIKQGAKEAKGGKKVKASTYESLTGFKNKKGSSKGMRRGMSTANTSIKVPNLSRGPRA